MPHYLAFLRGINLGRRRIKMDRLTALFAELKFTGVESFIASGNVAFSSRVADEAKLVAQIQRHLHAALGYEVGTFIRTRAEVATAAAFPGFSAADPDDDSVTVHVGFLAAPLSAAQQRGLEACQSAHDEFRVAGREYYWLCRGIKTHESKIWASPAVKALKLPTATMRNLTTVRKLAALYPPAAP